MPLEPTSIDGFRPKITPYKVGDGRGLYLEVRPNGAKYWRLRYRWAGKQSTLSCGVYPDTGLAEARERRDAAWQLIAEGINPSEHAMRKRALARDEESQQRAATRFAIDNDGALSFRLGARRLSLTPAETVELRVFLDATRQVTPKR
ncbi:MAG: Arm DNA-binding domain-containing protein [Azonexus sp.]|nr:Arm DNA-binding domain-containing protein [Azonexus sp.]MCK6412835.1 Arm DNA-binding domain-containing protein [Azonexus sp.]